MSRTGPRERRTGLVVCVTALVGAVGSSTLAGASTTPSTGNSMSGASMAKMKSASALARAKPIAVADITIRNFSFSPGAVKVHPGQRVKVTNGDTVAHTVTSLTGKFDTGDVSPGRTVTLVAPRKPGRYPYRCTIHQYMTGMLVVSSGRR